MRENMCVLVCLHTLMLICKTRLTQVGEGRVLSMCVSVCVSACAFKRLRQGRVERYFTQTKR